MCIRDRYNTSGYLASITDSASRQQTFTYDTSNNLKTITDAAGKTTTFDYTGAGGTIGKITDPDGYQTIFTKDSAGRILAVKRVTNAATGAGYTWTFDYASPVSACLYASVAVKATLVTDPNGHETRYEMCIRDR